MDRRDRRKIDFLRAAWEKLPLWCPILGSHIHRLGFLRVMVGAIGMYASIPVFILIHAVTIQLIMRLVVYPIFNLGTLNTKNFIILDRYKVEGLSAVDKFHCLFCGWANGIYTFLNDRTDRISETLPPLGRPQKVLLGCVCLSYILPSVIIQTLLFFIYNYLIASPLRLEKVYYGPLVRQYQRNSAYAEQYGPWGRRFLVYQKITWTALGLALRQIESAWCPIKHFEKMTNIVYPDHHRLFFEPHQIDELRRFLSEHGTVLARANPVDSKK
jgi:hypothetical protein